MNIVVFLACVATALFLEDATASPSQQGYRILRWATGLAACFFWALVIG